MSFNLAPAQPIPDIEPLPEHVYLWYGRISRKGEEGKATSLPKQERACLEALQQFEKAPALARFFKSWSEDHTGREFETRPKVMEMYRWCELHQRPRTNPGWIFLWEQSRFYRAVIPGTDRPDLAMFGIWKGKFEVLGWQLYPLDAPPTGEAMTDFLIGGVRGAQAGAESAKIMQRTKEGREEVHDKGFWSCARAPWPTARYDARTGELLREATYGPAEWVDKEDGKRVWTHPVLTPSVLSRKDAKVVLGPRSENDLKLWEAAAQHVVEDHWSSERVVEWFNRNVPTLFPGSSWDWKSIVRALTHPVLIGRVERKQNGVSVVRKAQWDPMVPLDLFDQVGRAVGMRAARGRHGPRERKNKRHEFLLTGKLVCAKCGLPYGQNYGGKGRPRYVHAWRAFNGVTPEQRAKAKAAGCYEVTIQARQAEQAMIDLIASERGSPDWFATWKQLREKTGVIEAEHEHRVAFAKNRVQQARKAQENAEYYALQAANERERSKWQQRSREADAEVDAAEAALAAAERQAQAARAEYRNVDTVMKEAVLVREAYAKGDADRCRAIIDQWIHRAYVAVEQVAPRTARAAKRGVTVAQKTLLCLLETTPHDPRPVKLKPYYRPDGVALSHVVGSAANYQEYFEAATSGRPNYAVRMTSHARTGKPAQVFPLK